MPLQGEYEPTTSDFVRKNAQSYMSSDGTQGTELQPAERSRSMGRRVYGPGQDSAQKGALHQ